MARNKKRSMALMCALAICLTFSGPAWAILEISLSTPIPIQEEFVFAQALHTAMLWDTIALDLFEAEGIGTSDITGSLDYEGSFAILLDSSGNPVNGSYAGVLTGIYAGDAWTGSIGASMTADAAGLNFDLSGEVDSGGIPSRMYRIRTGRILEFPDNKATVFLTIDRVSGGSFFGRAEELPKTKAGGLLTVRGPIRISGHDETLVFKINQADKRWEMALTSQIENRLFSLTGTGRYDFTFPDIPGSVTGTMSGQLGQTVRRVPEPSTAIMSIMSILGVLGYTWRRRSRAVCA